MDSLQFSNPNPATGQSGTLVTTTWFQNVNDEISNVITKNGGTVDSTNSSQLYQTLQSTYAPLLSPTFTGVPLVPDTNSTSDGRAIVNFESMKAYVAAGQLGYTPVHQGGGTDQGTNSVYIGWSGSDLLCTVDDIDLGAFAFKDYVSANYLNLTGGNVTGTFTYNGTTVATKNDVNAAQTDTENWVTANYVSDTTWNSNINQDIRTTASPTFNLVSTKTISFDNGGNSSIYQDTNSSDIVLHTNDGSDHYTVFSASGNTNFPGSTFAYDVNAGFNSGWGGGTASGDNRWVNGHICFGAPTGDSSAYAGYFQIVDRLDYGQDNGSGINMFGFDAAGGRHDWYFPWNGNIVTPAGTVAFQSWVNSNYVPWSSYSDDFLTGDSRILNLAYGHRILTWSVNANYGDWITFPQSFSSAPTSIVGQGTVDSNRPIAIAIFNQNNSGFNFYPRRLDQDGSSNADGGLLYYFIAIGPK